MLYSLPSMAATLRAVAARREKCFPSIFCIYASANCSQATAWPGERPQAGKRLGGQRIAML